MTSCVACNLASDAARLPRGWKRIRDEVLCKSCFQDRYVLRAVTVPVAGALAGTQEERREWWKRFRAELVIAWRAATRTANWTVSELFAAEPRAAASKFPKPPPIDKPSLYHRAREIAPELDTRSTSAVVRTVERRWRKKRFDVVWRGNSSVPDHRYPQPIPVHNACWKVEEHEGGAVTVSFPLLKHGTGERWRCRLRGGRGFHAAIKDARLLAQGTAIRGELAILRQIDNGSGRGNGGKVKRAGGGNARRYRVALKLVGYWPRKSLGERQHTMKVWPGVDSLLCYCVDGKGDSKVRYLHCDHVRRWLIAHRRQVQRLADDRKAERRRPRAERLRYLEAQSPRIERFGRRLDTHTHEVSRVLVNYARRRRCAEIVYDPRPGSYARGYRWSSLWTKLTYKADELKIKVMSAELPETVAEALADQPKEEVDA